MARALTEDELNIEETSFEDQDDQEEQKRQAIGATSNYPFINMTDTVPVELQNQLDVLDAQFASGELGITDYMKQRSAVDRQIISYQISEANSQNAHNGWMAAQTEFMHENNHYAENKILYEALAHAVKVIQGDVRSKSLTPTQVLNAADYLLRHSFDIALEIGINDVQSDLKSKGLRPAQILKALKVADNLERVSFDKEEDGEAGMVQIIWS